MHKTQISQSTNKAQNTNFTKHKLFVFSGFWRLCFIWVLCSVFWVFPLLVFAAGLVPCGGPTEPDCNLCFFAEMVDKVVSFLTINLIAPLGVIAFIYAGFLLITAGGNPSKLEQGKAVFKYTIIGVLIAFAAWLIIDTILKYLLDASFGPWNDFPDC